jgi:hypothetical protein
MFQDVVVLSIPNESHLPKAPPRSRELTETDEP